ncbi:MAG: NapC/NirT family cytochrome c [Planctomycetota bacterium]
MGKQTQGRDPGKRRRLRKLGIGAGALAALCVFSIGAWHALEWTNRNELCGSCHEMEEAYQSWISSTHYHNASGMRVACVECHLPPRERIVEHLLVKTGVGTREVAKHLLGRAYGEEALRERILEEMPDAWCMKCHEDLFAPEMDVSAHIAHTVSVFPVKGNERNCVSCHPWVGHKRAGMEPATQAAGGGAAAEQP